MEVKRLTISLSRNIPTWKILIVVILQTEELDVSTFETYRHFIFQVSLQNDRASKWVLIRRCTIHLLQSYNNWKHQYPDIQFIFYTITTVETFSASIRFEI